MSAPSAPPLARALAAALALLVAALSGCTRERAAAEPTDSSTGAALDGAAVEGPAAVAAPPTPARVTAAEFRALRWLLGSWRGRMPDGKFFYERYALANDSTIKVSYYSDSTFARPTGEDSVVLRGGELRFDRATAVRVEAAGVDFAGPAGSGFVWSPAASGWTATLRGTRQDGQRYTTVYRMAPFTPPAR